MFVRPTASKLYVCSNKSGKTQWKLKIKVSWNVTPCRLVSWIAMPSSSVLLEALFASRRSVTFRKTWIIRKPNVSVPHFVQLRSVAARRKGVACVCQDSPTAFLICYTVLCVNPQRNIVHNGICTVWQIDTFVLPHHSVLQNVTDALRLLFYFSTEVYH
jgi:hypothetical protein